MIYECVLASSAQTTSLPQLQAVEGGTRQWEITLRVSPDVDSAPVDLTDVDEVEFLSTIRSCTTKTTIRQLCDIIDPYSGRISLSLGPTELQTPGLWKGAIQTRNSNGDTLDEYPCRLLIARSILNPEAVELPTVGEIRSFMMDRCSGDNRLLLSTQFTDDQIMDFMQFAVDEWNDTPPNVLSFNTGTFPWRMPWITATAAHLLRSVSIQQIRNNATFQSGTVSVNDSDKGREFNQMGNQLYQEWRAWMLAKKREININLGWGGSGISSFGR